MYNPFFNSLIPKKKKKKKKKIVNLYSLTQEKMTADKAQ
jgi:hypothetical protein